MSIFLSFFGITAYKFLLYTLLYFLLSFYQSVPSPKHSQCIKALQYQSWLCFKCILNWLSTDYIMRYFLKIQHIFSDCTGLTLGPIIYILNHFYQSNMTLRQFFVSWGTSYNISGQANCRVSSVKY